MTRFLLGSLVLLCGCGPEAPRVPAPRPPEPGEFTGTILNPDGGPRAHASITVDLEEPLDGGSQARFLADGQGRFSLPGVWVDGRIDWRMRIYFAVDAPELSAGLYVSVLLRQDSVPPDGGVELPALQLPADEFWFWRSSDYYSVIAPTTLTTASVCHPCQDACAPRFGSFEGNQRLSCKGLTDARGAGFELPRLPDPSGEAFYLFDRGSLGPGIFVTRVRIKQLADAAAAPNPQPCDWAYASIPPASPSPLRPTWGPDAPTQELQDVASSMVGRWQGIRVNQVGDSRQVKFAFFANGLYSAVCSDGPSLPIGGNCHDHRPSWRVTSGSRAVAAGELPLAAFDGPVSLSNIRVDAQTLSFEASYPRQSVMRYSLTRAP